MKVKELKDFCDPRLEDLLDYFDVQPLWIISDGEPTKHDLEMLAREISILLPQEDTDDNI